MATPKEQASALWRGFRGTIPAHLLPDDKWNPRPGIDTPGGPGWLWYANGYVNNPGQATHSHHIGWLIEALEGTGVPATPQEPLNSGKIGVAIYRLFEGEGLASEWGDVADGWAWTKAFGNVTTRALWWGKDEETAANELFHGRQGTKAVTGGWSVLPGWSHAETQRPAPADLETYLASLKMVDEAAMRVKLKLTDPVPQPPPEPPVEPPVDPPAPPSPPTPPPPPIDDVWRAEIESRLFEIGHDIAELTERLDALPLPMKGDRGDKGEKGDKGDRGEQGPKGDRGEPGGAVQPPAPPNPPSPPAPPEPPPSGGEVLLDGYGWKPTTAAPQRTLGPIPIAGGATFIVDVDVVDSQPGNQVICWLTPDLRKQTAEAVYVILVGDELRVRQRRVRPQTPEQRKAEILGTTRVRPGESVRVRTAIGSLGSVTVFVDVNGNPRMARTAEPQDGRPLFVWLSSLPADETHGEEAPSYGWPYRVEVRRP